MVDRGVEIEKAMNRDDGIREMGKQICVLVKLLLTSLLNLN